MILRLLGWLRRIGAAEYWRLRAHRAEAALEAEVWRNRNREDVFVSAAILGGRGMVGIAPRSAPATLPGTAPRVLQAANPWETLTWHEKAEFETEWLMPAMNQGISKQKAEADFMAELLRRKQHPDEAMIG